MLVCVLTYMHICVDPCVRCMPMSVLRIWSWRNHTLSPPHPYPNPLTYPHRMLHMLHMVLSSHTSPLHVLPSSILLRVLSFHPSHHLSLVGIILSHSLHFFLAALLLHHHNRLKRVPTNTLSPILLLHILRLIILHWHPTTIGAILLWHLHLYSPSSVCMYGLSHRYHHLYPIGYIPL